MHAHITGPITITQNVPVYVNSGPSVLKLLAGNVQGKKEKRRRKEREPGERERERGGGGGRRAGYPSAVPRFFPKKPKMLK